MSIIDEVKDLYAVKDPIREVFLQTISACQVWDITYDQWKKIDFLLNKYAEEECGKLLVFGQL